MKNGYTADDGLGVLGYLGLTNLTQQEMDFFNEKLGWIYHYDSSRGGDLIRTTRKIYCEILPLSIDSHIGNGNGKSKKERLSRETESRYKEFDRRLGRSNLSHILKRA